MKPNELAWQIDARARIQHLLLDLYRLAKQPNALQTRDDGRIFSLLVGAAFSLWRAAFLVVWENKDGQDVALTHETKLLEKVVETNAITFSDDKSSAAWSFAYYLDNARVRIQQAAGDGFVFDEGPLQLAKVIINRRISRIDHLKPFERFREWDCTCDAIERLLKTFAG